MLAAPAVTFTLFKDGHTNIAGAANEREAQRCWTWFSTAVLSRFRRAGAVADATAPAVEGGDGSSSEAALVLDRLAGAWRGHTRACPCVRAPANDFAFFEALHATLRRAGDDEAALRAALQPHVEARCLAAMPTSRDDLAAAARALAAACDRQRLVLTELVGGGGGAATADAEDSAAAAAAVNLHDAVMSAQMDALRAGSDAVMFVPV